MVKRSFDIAVSMLLMVVLAPFIVLIALLIFAGDGRSPLYLQVRVGRGTAPFTIYKFRSMRPDADRIGGYMTEQNDPRITRVGGFLRRTSLDELPQVFNVLKGDMSLVGPQPDVPAQQPLYHPEDWVKRHSVRPGITGLAQVRGRSDTTFEARLANDLDYVARHSLFRDISILLATAKVFARGV